MNIFYVHEDPEVAARMLCDKHVVKMTLETAQILSTVLGGPYRPTHARHPSVIWAADNIPWVMRHFKALLAEYTFRYGRQHKSGEILPLLTQKASTAQPKAFTPPPLCMPEAYHGPDPVEAYRTYYATDKAPIAKWERARPAPEWFTARISLPV
jgi:hypothetical protein